MDIDFYRTGIPFVCPGKLAREEKFRALFNCFFYLGNHFDKAKIFFMFTPELF